MTKILTTGQVARLCKVTPRLVSKWFDSGKLKGYRIPGSQDRRIPSENLVQFLKENDMKIPSSLQEESSQPNSVPCQIWLVISSAGDACPGVYANSKGAQEAVMNYIYEDHWMQKLPSIHRKVMHMLKGEPGEAIEFYNSVCGSGSTWLIIETKIHGSHQAESASNKAIRERFCDIVPGLTSKSWEDIWERVRDIVNSHRETRFANGQHVFDHYGVGEEKTEQISGIRKHSSF